MGELSERAMWVTAVMDPANPSLLKQFQIEGTETPDKYKPARVAVPALMADAATRLEALRAQDALSGHCGSHRTAGSFWTGAVVMPIVPLEFQWAWIRNSASRPPTRCLPP